MSIPAGWSVYESPIGPLRLVVGPRGLTTVHFPERAPRLPEGFRTEFDKKGWRH